MTDDTINNLGDASFINLEMEGKNIKRRVEESTATSFRKASEDGNVVEIEDSSEVLKKAHSLSPKEMEKRYYIYMQKEKLNKTLKKNKYAELKSGFPNTYVLQNKTTELIAEIDAFSPIHACNLAGWHHKKVIMLSENKKGA